MVDATGAGRKARPLSFASVEADGLVHAETFESKFFP
jgi:hypothetical protein